MNVCFDIGGKRIAALLPLAVAGWLAAGSTARADDWVERPFDPPASSRWIIQSNETTRDDRDGAEHTSVAAQTAELTIEGKTDEGFRITYLVRNGHYEGDARTAALVDPVLKALESVRVQATTARNGMPLRIDNLAEVKAAGRAAIDDLVARFADRPQQAEVMRQLATRILITNAEQAPAVYLKSLATLALGQNTGLKPGETRHNDNDVVDLFGGAPIKARTTLRIDSADPASGNVRYVRTRTFDPDALREFLTKLAQQLVGKQMPAAQFEKFLQQFRMTLDSRTEIDVEQGMTRAVREDDVTKAGTPGHTVVKHAHNVLTVARAP